MTTDFRALCVELTDCLEKADWPLRHRYVFRQWIDIARAALADEPAVPEGREPASVTEQPSDGEVAELVAELVAQLQEDAYDYECIGEKDSAAKCNRGADLLQRLSPPQPVPVSERLPGPEDCDAEGGCWWLVTGCNAWSFGKYLASVVTHWLPAHALPQPLPEVGQ